MERDTLVVSARPEATSPYVEVVEREWERRIADDRL
jgi:hypothetical protein